MANGIQSFTLERQVENWDTDFLEARLRALFASVRYTGHFEVSFPQLYSTVIVQNREIEKGGMFSSLFRQKVKTLAMKNYQVVKALWP